MTALERYGRPIICSEYMARPRGSTFQNDPADLRAAACRRVSTGDSSPGKTQTIYPWDSWDREYTAEPAGVVPRHFQERRDAVRRGGGRVHSLDHGDRGEALITRLARARCAIFRG